MPQLLLSKKLLKLWMDAIHKELEPFKIWPSPKNNWEKTEICQLKLKKPEEEKLMPSKLPLKYIKFPQELLMKPQSSQKKSGPEKPHSFNYLDTLTEC